MFFPFVDDEVYMAGKTVKMELDQETVDLISSALPVMIKNVESGIGRSQIVAVREATKRYVDELRLALKRFQDASAGQKSVV